MLCCRQYRQIVVARPRWTCYFISFSSKIRSKIGISVLLMSKISKAGWNPCTISWRSPAQVRGWSGAAGAHLLFWSTSAQTNYPRPAQLAHKVSNRYAASVVQLVHLTQSNTSHLNFDKNYLKQNITSKLGHSGGFQKSNFEIFFIHGEGMAMTGNCKIRPF